MKKFLTILAVLLAIGGVAGTVYFYIQYKDVSSERETLVQQNGALQSAIDAIGPVTTAYTVAAPVTTRDIISKDDFVEITVPESSMTDDVIRDVSTIDGKLYKVDIQPGTAITSSMIMDVAYEETLHEKDLVFDYLPLGLKVGDFVDIKISFPFGQTFVVTQHLRIKQIVLEANTVKVDFTAAQEALWTSARKDYALTHNYGTDLYLSKYVEPGVDEDEIVAFYPVRSEMESVVNVDPNIKDASLCVNSNLRTQLDYMLESVSQEDGSTLSSGISSEASAINSAASQYVEDTNGNVKSSGTSTDAIDLEGASEELNEASDALNSDTSPSITDSQKNESLGGSLFGDETVLE